ncbi:hypothetical protein CS388_03410 [Porphyromonas gingivalis]|nr:hypothetical protein CS545_08880 [Porphyromonas gingivalis]ATS08164.1 hypothetical protein CS388_03410 [Porphyromonas gingivalis]
MLFHAPQRLGKQFLLPVEKGFDSRGRGAYRLPYIIIGMSSCNSFIDITTKQISIIQNKLKP